MCQLLGMNCNTPTDIVFSFEGFRRRAGLTDCHSDGFGIAFFEGRGVRIFRDNHAASQSPIADCVKQYNIKSLNVIAHIRKATQGGVTIENTHPFIREIWGQNWVFAHNGNLKELPDMSESFCQPIGSTDSEAAFCYMAEYLKNRFRRKPSEMEIFEAIQDITKELSQKGTFNFILSNGEWMSSILMIMQKMATKSRSLQLSLSPKMNLGSKWNMVGLFSSKKGTKSQRLSVWLKKWKMMAH